MKLNEEFEQDIREAFDYWCQKQKEPATITIEQWVVAVLQKPVYELIGAKRTENA